MVQLSLVDVVVHSIMLDAILVVAVVSVVLLRIHIKMYLGTSSMPLYVAVMAYM